jgi:hypothetical protein
VDQAGVTLLDSSGDKLILQVLRAQDAGNLPLEIRSPAGESQSFVLALSNVKLVTPGADWFVPPEGFTKYGNESSLIGELAERIQNFYGQKREPVAPDSMRSGQPGPP